MANVYTKATQGLQNVGRQIRTNLSAGQKSPRSRQANYSINPVKGTRSAFMSAFKKKSARNAIAKKGFTTNYSK